MADPSAGRSVPSYVEEVFEALQTHITATEEGLPEDLVRKRLDEDGFESATITAALEYLLLHGYLYEVDGRLRVAAEEM